MNLRSALLITRHPTHIINLMKQCGKLETLYIKVMPILNNDSWSCKLDTRISPKQFHDGVVGCYRSCEYADIDIRIVLTNRQDCESLGVPTSKLIEAVFYDMTYSSSAVSNFVRYHVPNKSENCELIACEGTATEEQDTPATDNFEFKSYNSVVLGGTFDKIHIGHKLLFTEAILRCKKRLTVGVVSDQMLQSKVLSEFIDPCEKRMKNVEEFLLDVNPNLTYSVIEINDIYGPTKTDPTFEVVPSTSVNKTTVVYDFIRSLFQMIVVSTETKKGAEKINEARKNAGLNELEVIEIEILDCDNNSSYEETKVSSSNQRMRTLGTLIKIPCQPRPELPDKPYIIGLTGGIASGKSSVMKYMKELGCGCINCDELGHSVYDVGSNGYEFIKKSFGENVFKQDGTVDRTALGSIVFSDPEKRSQLNKGLWPLILDHVKEEITKFKYKDVVVIEAALLIQANWSNQCHEIWSCIIPQNEAVKRLQLRNKLSAEEAQARVSAQLPNREIVANSNIIFCTFWDPLFTRSQVEKAMKNLKQRISFS